MAFNSLSPIYLPITSTVAILYSVVCLTDYLSRALRGNDKIKSATVVRKRDHPYVPQTSKK